MDSVDHIAQSAEPGYWLLLFLVSVFGIVFYIINKDDKARRQRRAKRQDEPVLHPGNYGRKPAPKRPRPKRVPPAQRQTPAYTQSETRRVSDEDYQRRRRQDESDDDLLLTAAAIAVMSDAGESNNDSSGGSSYDSGSSGSSSSSYDSGSGGWD